MMLKMECGGQRSGIEAKHDITGGAAPAQGVLRCGIWTYCAAAALGAHVMTLLVLYEGIPRGWLFLEQPVLRSV